MPPRKLPAAAPGRRLGVGGDASGEVLELEAGEDDGNGEAEPAGEGEEARKKTSAPATTSATPATSSARAASEDTVGDSLSR